MNIALNADCMEVMRQYPDQYFDLAVVDPPYGDGGGSFNRGTRFGGKFDRYKPIDRTGRTWAKDYGKAIIDWDVAPGPNTLRNCSGFPKNKSFGVAIISGCPQTGAF